MTVAQSGTPPVKTFCTFYYEFVNKQNRKISMSLPDWLYKYIIVNNLKKVSSSSKSHNFFMNIFHLFTP